jgi:hypothetical protein
MAQTMEIAKNFTYKVIDKVILQYSMIKSHIVEDKKPKKVRFTKETKCYDGIEPLKEVFLNIIIDYFTGKIETFIDIICNPKITASNIEYIKMLVYKLLERMSNEEYNSSIPILPNGGSSLKLVKRHFHSLEILLIMMDKCVEILEEIGEL